MKSEALATHSDEYDWEYEVGEEGRTDVIRWKTLVTGDRTPTRGISFGVLEIPPGAGLSAHHHPPQEVYHVTEGSGVLLLGDQYIDVKPGSVIYIPERTVHGIWNRGSETLKFTWIFATDTWAEIEYTRLEETGEPDTGS